MSCKVVDMLLLAISLFHGMYRGLKDYYTAYSQKRARRILEHIYLNLVRSRLGIDTSVNDNIIRKAQFVVEVMIQSPEWKSLLENVPVPLKQCRLVFDAMGRETSPTHIVLGVYFVIEVNIQRQYITTTNYETSFERLIPLHIREKCFWFIWANM